MLTLEYRPNKFVLERESFNDYLKVVPGAAVEQLVVTIRDDIANEVVPNFVRVTFATEEAGANYTVATEENIVALSAPQAYSPTARRRDPS